MESLDLAFDGASESFVGVPGEVRAVLVLSPYSALLVIPILVLSPYEIYTLTLVLPATELGPVNVGWIKVSLCYFPRICFPWARFCLLLLLFFFLIQGRTWTFGLISMPAPKPRHQIYVAVSNQQISVQSYTKLMLLKLTGFYYDRSLLCQLLPIPWPWLPSALWLKCLNFCPGMCACQSAGRWGIAYLSLTHPLIISNWHVFICSFILKYWVSALPVFHCWRYSGQVRQIRSLIWWCLYSRERKAHNKHVNKWDNSR